MLGIYGTYYHITATDSEFWYWAVRLGDYAWALFWLILFVSPLSVLLPSVLGRQLFQRVMTFRRELGILMTWLVYYHAFFLLISVTNFSKLAQDIMNISNPWFWGAFTGVAVFVMGITSNNLSIRLFSALWKHVHKLAYVVLISGMLHVALVNGEFEEFITLLPAYLLLKWLVTVKQKLAVPVVRVQPLRH